MSDEPRVQTFCEHLQALIADAKTPRSLSSEEKREWRTYFDECREFIQNCCLKRASAGKQTIRFSWYKASSKLECSDLDLVSTSRSIGIYNFEKIKCDKSIRSLVLKEFRRILGPGVELSLSLNLDFVNVDVKIPSKEPRQKQKTIMDRFDDIEQAIALLPPNGGGTEYCAAATRFAAASGRR